MFSRPLFMLACVLPWCTGLHAATVTRRDAVVIQTAQSPTVVYGEIGVAGESGTFTFLPAEPIGPRIASPGATTNFDGLDFDITQPLAPPDSNGAVGPNHVVTVINTGIGIRDRNGTSVRAQVRLSAFFNSVLVANDTVSDPHLLYDSSMQKWILSAMSLNINATNGTETGGAALLAVSQTSDPTNAWDMWKIGAEPTNSNVIFDAPTLGINKDWIVIAGDLFSSSGTFNFYGVNYFVFTKTNLTGGAHRLLRDRTGSFAPAPAVTHDTNLATEFVIQDYNGTNAQMRISTITGPIGSEVLTVNATTFTVSGVSAWADWNATFNTLPQLGNTTGIEANDSRTSYCVYRNGYLWTSHTLFLPVSAPTHTAVQWMQFTTNGTVRQVGRIEDPTATSTNGLHYAYSSIAVNKNDAVLLGYGRFGKSQYAGGDYAVRCTYDPLNTMRDGVEFKPGLNVYNISGGLGSPENRWGDYSTTVVDPADDTTMWTIQEYASGTVNRWGTWWAEVLPPPLIAPTMTNAHVSGINFVFSVPTAANQPYRAEYKDDLNASGWTLLQGFTGDGNVQSFSNGISSTKRVYRVESP